MNRITDTCKNITLATTSLWPVIMSLMLEKSIALGLFFVQNIENSHKILLLTLYRIVQKWPKFNEF